MTTQPDEAKLQHLQKLAIALQERERLRAELRMVNAIIWRMRQPKQANADKRTQAHGQETHPPDRAPTAHT